jgi:hypothetical protein
MRAMEVAAWVVVGVGIVVPPVVDVPTIEVDRCPEKLL